MKKQKIVIGFNALLLTVFGFLATKGSNRFAHPMGGCFVTVGGGVIALAGGLTAGFDTSSVGGKSPVRMVTVNGTIIGTLYTGIHPGSHKVYR